MTEIRKLNKRLGVYLQGVTEIVIDENAPAVIARAPVEAGYSRFIEVDDLPDIEDLPFIPERLRDFAFRYATEYKTLKSWAKDYNVNPATVSMWLSNPGVKSYIALARFEKRFYTMARRSALENKVWERLNDFMSIKITGDNAGAVARILEFSYNILNSPDSVPHREKGVFNQAIYVGGNPESGSSNTGTYARPPSEKQLLELEKRIARVRMLEERKADMDAEVDGVEWETEE